MTDYLALERTMLICSNCSCAYVVGYLTTFEHENAFAIYCFSGIFDIT